MIQDIDNELSPPTPGGFEWDGGISVVSNWEGTLGAIDFKGVRDSIPNAISR